MMCNLTRSCLLSILFILALLTKGISQHSTRPFSMQLSVGAALPVGKFEKKVISYHPDSSYGLAKPGPAVSIKAGYRMSEEISLSLLVLGMLNRVDKKAFESDGFRTPNAWSHITTHNWKILSFMAGPEFHFHNGKKGLVISPGLHAGVIKTGFPGDTVVYHSDREGTLTDQIYATWRDKFQMRWAFCYQASAEVEYPVTQRLYINCTAGFFSSGRLRSAKYDGDTRRFKVSTINILAGVRVLL